MAGLDILGGIGKGIMQGENFVQNRDYNTARLEAIKEDSAYTRQQRQLEAEERGRVNQVAEGYRSSIVDGKFNPDKFLQTHGHLLKMQETDAILEKKRQLDNLFGKEAVRKARATKDYSDIAAFLDKKGAHFRIEGDQMTVEGQPLSIEGFEQLYDLGNSIEEKLKLGELQSKISLYDAQKGYYDVKAKEALRPKGGGGGSSGHGSGKPFMSYKDAQAVIENTRTNNSDFNKHFSGLNLEQQEAYIQNLMRYGTLVPTLSSTRTHFINRISLRTRIIEKAR